MLFRSLAVSFASTTTSVCTVAGTAVTLVSTGSCSITASQPGNGTYAVAVPVTQTFTVAPAALNAQGYIISTLAGNDNSGYSGDGGTAVATSLYFPRSVAIDPAGNIYIADTSNYRLRKVAPSTGIIATLAGIGSLGFSGDGGAAANAAVGSISGVALDGIGNLYISDQNNSRVRQINAATGEIGRAHV